MKLNLKMIILFLSVFNISVMAQEEVASDARKLEQLEEKTAGMEKALQKLKNFKVSGYIQAQFEYGQKDASLKVGKGNENPENGFNRIGIRRGRIKFTYEEGIASGVFQLDLTEKGVGFKDAYLNIKDPWTKRSALRAGIFDRPFGYEISYSSSQRESPERSTIFQTLFPEERDLGAMLILQPSATSALHFMKFEGGIFAGNGIKPETDDRKDFIGKLSAADKIGQNFNYGLGVSYYNGGVYQGTKNVYKMSGKEFVQNTDDSNIGKFAKREYVGFDGRIGLNSIIGLTQLRGEFLLGQQPGTATSTKSPNGALPDYDTYIRKFNGGYIMFVQDIATSPFSAIVKYDWYDPNTNVSGNDVGLNGTGKADASCDALGLGALWRVNKNIRLQAYYELRKYEKTESITGLNDLKDDTFTLRIQYKF
jgi:phosphate-selective porin